MTLHWQTRATLMRTFATLPGGPTAYRLLQRTVGRLTHDPMPRLPDALALARSIADARGSLSGLTLFEVGTGHLPLVPIFLSLLGPRTIHTVDLYRRLDRPTLARALRAISAHRDEVEAACTPLADRRASLGRRLDRLAQASDPLRYLQDAGIQYDAPADATRTTLPSGSIDAHLSHTVLEHVPPVILSGIFREARRLLAPKGVACHLIDLSDHRSHTDASLASVDFLRYSAPEWDRIAGNQFAYCSRLRKSQYATIFRDAGFAIDHDEPTLDREALSAVRVHPDFAGLAPDDLATVVWRVRLRPEHAH